MYNILFAHLKKKVTLTSTEKERIKSFFKARKLERKECLLREGEICEVLSFVASGILKSFTADEKGSEHISMFAVEGWWISDLNSFFNREKAILSIDALETSELLTVSLADYETMMTELPVMNRYFRILFQNSLMTKDHRLMVFSSYTAEEKYIHFAQTHPEMLRKIPHRLIASYLGLAPETVSRIRKKLAGR